MLMGGVGAIFATIDHGCPRYSTAHTPGKGTPASTQHTSTASKQQTRTGCSQLMKGRSHCNCLLLRPQTIWQRFHIPGLQMSRATRLV